MATRILAAAPEAYPRDPPRFTMHPEQRTANLQALLERIGESARHSTR